MATGTKTVDMTPTQPVSPLNGLECVGVFVSDPATIPHPRRGCVVGQSRTVDTSSHRR